MNYFILKYKNIKWKYKIFTDSYEKDDLAKLSYYYREQLLEAWNLLNKGERRELIVPPDIVLYYKSVIVL